MNICSSRQMRSARIGSTHERRRAARNGSFHPTRPNRLDDDRHSGRHRPGAAPIRLGCIGGRRGTAAHHARIGRRLRRRTGRHRLPARSAARVRRGPHRRDRQHHPQAGREGKRSLSAGFWFSLGHSSIVFGLAFLLAIGVRAIVGPVQDEGSPLLQTLGLVGSLVAGTFLILIGLTNLFAVVGIAKVFRRMRSGDFDEAELERQLENRGFLARLLARVMRRVSKSWHLYPVGLLMGLGFDTATQVALLVLAAGTAAFTLPWYAILVLPVLFAAGMSLFDALDGIFMSRAYGWAFLQPIRKVYYKLTVTVR